MVSGLNVVVINFDVIGNNIVNFVIYGFKFGMVLFVDMFVGFKVGLGVKVVGIIQDFIDGMIMNIGCGLDVVIS